MRIGKAARVLDIHPDTLRKLERQGVFKAQRDWRGHRRFTDDDLKRLQELLFPRQGEVQRVTGDNDDDESRDDS